MTIKLQTEIANGWVYVLRVSSENIKHLELILLYERDTNIRKITKPCISANDGDNSMLVLHFCWCCD